MDQAQDEPTEATRAFELYKENFASSLVSKSYEIKVDDVFILATAL